MTEHVGQLAVIVLRPCRGDRRSKFAGAPGKAEQALVAGFEILPDGQRRLRRLSDKRDDSRGIRWNVLELFQFI